MAAAQQSGIEIVILRPPLVYGPGVRANFRRLMRLAASGLPLPLAGIDNRRSLIFTENLVDLVGRACLHPRAAGQVLLARDGVDFSTPELIRLLAAAMGRPARLFGVPPSALSAFCGLPLVGPSLARLTLSLQVDDAETRAALDWRPPVSPEIGLQATTAAFRALPRREQARGGGVVVPSPPCEPPMSALTEDTLLIRQAVAYVIELYRELSEENGAPSLGTQNQAVDFILADPELCAAAARWSQLVDSDEATTTPLRRLPFDPAYRRIRAYLEAIMDRPVFTLPGQEPPDRR
jgi:hypothetical protein